MFSDQKIRIIKKMPEGKSIILIWVQLLTMAGKTNDKGRIYISEKLPYTDDMLAVVMDEDVVIVRMALTVLERFEMIDLHEDGGIEVVNWGKHQNVESMDRLREQTRKRVAKYRAKKKGLMPPKDGQKKSNSVTVTLPLRDVTQQKKKEREEEEVISKDITEKEIESAPETFFDLQKIYLDYFFKNSDQKTVLIQQSKFKGDFEAEIKAFVAHNWERSIFKTESITSNISKIYSWLHRSKSFNRNNRAKPEQPDPNKPVYTPPTNVISYD